MDFLSQYIPLPYSFNDYVFTAISDQISLKLVTLSHIPTTLIALALAIFLYKQSKQLSAFYLLLTTIVFVFWGYFDLMAWTSDARSVMFGWTLLETFALAFIALSYWFLYTFVKEEDVPNWQKIVSLLPIIPVYYSALANTYLSDYFYHAITPREDFGINFYGNIVEIIFLAVIIVFTLYQVGRATDAAKRTMTLLAGLGVSVMLVIYSVSSSITNAIVYMQDEGIFDFGLTVGESYNITNYMLMGVPILVSLLAYAVARHQAFGVKILQSVGYAVLLMVVFFIAAFV
jgi:hypothetical protein